MSKLHVSRLQMNGLKFLSILVISLFVPGQQVFAAPNKKAVNQDMASFISMGSFRGGSARVGASFSLAEVKRVISPSRKAERLVFELADVKGKKISGAPTFFQGQIKQNPPRINIDFSQTPATKFNQDRLVKLFKDSKIVKNVSLNLDPIDQTTTVTLYLRKSAKARVYSLGPKNNSPKVILDLAQIK